MKRSTHVREPADQSTEVDPAVPDLVMRTARGDTEAFERLYRLHVGLVYGLCLRMAGNPEEAEILTQDVFVRAWRKIGLYRGEGAFGAWLHRLAVNVVIEDRRRRAREASRFEAAGDELDAERAGKRMENRSRHSAAEVKMDLDRAIAVLPEGARTAFVLHDVYGYRHREISEMTGTASGTVKSQLSRARKLLREFLGERG